MALSTAVKWITWLIDCNHIPGLTALCAVLLSSRKVFVLEDPRGVRTEDQFTSPCPQTTHPCPRTLHSANSLVRMIMWSINLVTTVMH